MAVDESSIEVLTVFGASLQVCFTFVIDPASSSQIVKRARHGCAPDHYLLSHLWLLAKLLSCPGVLTLYVKKPTREMFTMLFWSVSMTAVKQFSVELLGMFRASLELDLTSQVNHAGYFPKRTLALFAQRVPHLPYPMLHYDKLLCVACPVLSYRLMVCGL